MGAARSAVRNQLRDTVSPPKDCFSVKQGLGYIRLDALSKRYVEGERTRVVLDEASAEFGRGEFVALLGRSGSGKSTLLNLVSGIDLPDSGAVWIDGQNLTAMSERERTLFRRRKIGFVFQFFNLIPTLTVLENVTLPLELDGAPRRASRRLRPSRCWKRWVCSIGPPVFPTGFPGASSSA